MSDRPSDAFELDELRDEFDWMFEFNSRMAERIMEDPDVHNLADYVSGLERENAELRDLVRTRTTTADETERFSLHMWNGGLVTVHVMECSKCGGTYEHVNGDYEYCPRCGRRIVEVDE